MQTYQDGNARLTTLTLFGLKQGQVRWGLAQMGTSGSHLKHVPGLLFHKLLGSGKGKAFSVQPNFSRYGLLCTWEHGEAAHDFFSKSKLMQEYKRRSKEIWTVYLEPLQSHGYWDKQQPFEPFAQPAAAPEPIAVLTRASINWRALPNFIRFGRHTSKALEEASGLICSIGLGELPFIRQATFSVWESVAAMKSYAYQNPQHQEVMKRTRLENWYSEELFARFAPIASEGTWDGTDPLEAKLLHQNN